MEARAVGIIISPSLRRLSRLWGLTSAAIWYPPPIGGTEIWPDESDRGHAFGLIRSLASLGPEDRVRVLIGERTITAMRFSDGVVLVAEHPTGHPVAKSLLRTMRRAHRAAPA